MNEAAEELDEVQTNLSEHRVSDEAMQRGNMMVRVSRNVALNLEKWKKVQMVVLFSLRRS